MKSSETINELAAALSKAQSDMGGAVKDSANPFFKSNYADLTSVIKAIKQPFSDNGLSYTQFPMNDETGIGVCTRLMHSSGQWLEMGYTLPMVKKDPQSASSSITYARRVAISAMAGIPTADDDAESAMIRSTKKISGDQINIINDLIAFTGTDSDKFCKAFKIPFVSDLLTLQYDRAVAALEAKK
jgi:hypothetical protein